MMLQTRMQTVSLNILPDTSKSKGKQAIKFGQLAQGMWGFFFQKPCRKWSREISSRPLFVFFKKASWKLMVSTLVSMFW